MKRAQAKRHKRTILNRHDTNSYRYIKYGTSLHLIRRHIYESPGIQFSIEQETLFIKRATSDTRATLYL